MGTRDSCFSRAEVVPHTGDEAASLTQENPHAQNVVDDSSGALELVLRRFPQRSERIELCYARLPAFREICEDYREVSLALRECRDAGGAPSAVAADDILALKEELETELLRALGDRALVDAGGAESSGCGG
jgi:hypothetical protein